MKVVVLYGSETGTAEELARRTANRLIEEAHDADLCALDDFPTHDLPLIRTLLVITSTVGDGEPPVNAASTLEYLEESTDLELKKTRFSVLGIGDSSYKLFCACAKSFDKTLEEHGAKRFYPRVDCDVDFAPDFDMWLEGVLAALRG